MRCPWSYGYSPEHHKVVIRNARGDVLMICVAPFAERILAKRVVDLINNHAVTQRRAKSDTAKLGRKRGRPPGPAKTHGPLGPRLPVG